MLQSLKTYLEIKRGLQASTEERALYQARELATLTGRAYHNVPFYTRLYDAAGVDPTRDVAPRELPIISKQSLRPAPSSERLSREYEGQTFWQAWSSGSTGEPLLTLVSGESTQKREALSYYAHHAHRLRPTDRIVQLVTVPQRTSSTQVHYRQYDADIVRMLGWLCDQETRALWGFPSYLGLLAEENLRQKVRLNLKVVLSLGESLVPGARELLAESFGAEVVEVYGSSELGLVGIGCSHGAGFHVSSDYLVEAVDAEGRAQEHGPGELCISALGQHAMPLIRYNIKDVASIDETPCGCGLRAPRIVDLAGREGASFYDRQGRGVSLGTLYFYRLLPEALLRVSIVQHVQGRLEIDVVPAPSAVLPLLERKLRECLDALYGDRFEYVLRIRDVDGSELLGKRLATVSHLRPADVVRR
jgi:phenylacetate-CoA ligase